MIKIAQKITWQAPTDDAIDSVEISKSATLYGSYSVLEAALPATSDSNPKSSSNTWVTSYTDSVGTRTDWYKIRFYDSDTSTYSEYSDPITSEELVRLCTVDEVKRVVDTIGRWTDDEIFDIITDVDDLIYIDFGAPLAAVWSHTGKIDSTLQDTYFVGEENIYRVDRFFYGTTTMTEYFLDDSYKVNNKYGMVRILPVASSGPTLDENSDVEIHYVPGIYNKISKYRTVKRLLEQTDYTSGDRTSKELEVINAKLDDMEKILSCKLFSLSSDYENYNPAYGVNRKKIIQDHDRNKYIAQYGW